MDGGGRHFNAAGAQGIGQPFGQRRREAVRREAFSVLVYFLRRARSDDLPFRHQRDAVHPGGFLRGLRDEDHAQPVFVHDGHKEVEDVPPVAGIERGGGLVANQVPGAHRRHGSDGQPLFFTTR